MAGPGFTPALHGQSTAGHHAPAPSAPAPDSAQPPDPHGQVVFSRSTETPGAAPAQSAAETAPASLATSVSDAMRAAPVFDSYAFIIHLQPATAAMEVELHATLTNGGNTPLTVLPLQLGSSLHFEHIRTAAGRALRFAAHTLQSDADHTGALTEAAVELPSPLATGGKLSLTIDYSGAIPASSVRLDRIGTPALLAQQSDWDRIGNGFTGLRGFGDTVWYPVCSVPALLGDGAKLFYEIGRQKRRNSAATVSMALTAEFTGEPPAFAVLDGHSVSPGRPLSMPSAGFPGVVRADLPPTVLGFGAPSLVLTTRVAAAATPLVAVAALPAHLPFVANYTDAAGLLEPLFRDWFGDRKPDPLLLLDLPLKDAAAADDGDALLLSLGNGTASEIADSLAGPLTHAYFRSPRAWLREGVAEFMSALWTERTQGREKALEQLAGDRAALTLAEPASPGSSPGEPLVTAQQPVFYRSKATAVLWMLRNYAGDAALGAALRAYDPAKDTTPEYFQTVLQKAIAADASAAPASADSATGQSAGEQSTDLGWFFRDWVYGDPGLPDLTIKNVFSNRTGAGDQWLVAVDIANTGYAETQVPVTARSASTSVTVQVRVPARGTLSRRILLQGEPTEVDVNDGSVPEVEASIHRKLIQ